MEEFWEHRKRFAKKRALDEQKKRALAQFSNDRVPPPSPDDPRPTRMAKPDDTVTTEVVAKVGCGADR